MTEYILSADPKIMGDKHPKFGYTFWGYAHDADYPIMFNSQNGNILKGQKLFAGKSEVKLSSNDTEYLRLSEVKLDKGVEIVSGQADSEQLPAGETPVKATNTAVLFTPGYAKDATLIPIQIYNGSLHYAKDAGLSLISNPEDRREYLEYVQEVSNELMGWVVRSRSAEDTNPEE